MYLKRRCTSTRFWTRFWRLRQWKKMVTSGNLPIENRVKRIQIENDPNNAPDDGAGRIEGGKRPSEAFGPTANGEKPPKTERKSKAQCRERREWVKLTVEIFTLFAVVGYAIVNARMYGAMVVANSNSRDSANAVTVAARAAEKANSIAQTSIEISNRAWMAPGFTRFSTYPATPKVGQFPEYFFDLTNPGKLPAIDVAFSVEEKDIPLSPKSLDSQVRGEASVSIKIICVLKQKELLVE